MVSLPPESRSKKDKEGSAKDGVSEADRQEVGGHRGEDKEHDDAPEVEQD